MAPSTQIPPIESRALTLLRELRHWNATRLATALGIKPGTIYEYEGGKVTPSREMLDRAAAALRLPPVVVSRVLALLRYVDSLSGEVNPSLQEIERKTSEMALDLEEALQAGFLRIQREARALAEREAAPVLWSRLLSHEPAQRVSVVKECQEFHRWALVERICRESIDAASSSADRAIELAELARTVAELVPGEPASRSRIQGYAWFHIANARRVAGKLPQAEEALKRARTFWETGKGSELGELLEESPVLELEASLRRAQRRLTESLDLLDQALAADPTGSRTSRILIKKAKTFEELGEMAEAVATLRRAEPLIDREREPGLFWNVRFNLLVDLCEVGRFAEADKMLPELEELRELAIGLGSELHLLRVVWAQGKIAAGLKRFEEAETAFQQVRRGFLARRIPFDAALVSLELAVFYLDQGRTKEVKEIARELAPVFASQGVSREALATLTLFRQAVERETITAEIARRLLHDLRKVGHGSSPGPESK
jgi:tetratricopeptide (TPR) repeat protein/DNA-binding XRE family transcriptional regulator